MKRILTLLILFCSTAVFLFGCSGAQGSEEAVAEPSVEDVVETAVEEAPEEVPVEAEPIDTSDLTLIGTTGRPQFLNAYASW